MADRLLKRVANLWEKLTQPHPVVQAVWLQFQVRLLAGILLLVCVLSMIGIILPALAGWRQPAFFVIYLWFFAASSGGLYFLARSRHHNVARLLTFALLSSIPFAALYSYRDLSSNSLRLALPWILIAFVLGGALLSVRGLGVLVAVNGLIVLGLVLFFPGIQIQGIVASSGLLFSVVVLLFVSKIYRNALESGRQAELVEVNRKLKLLSGQLEQTVNERTLALSSLEGQYRALVENNPMCVMRFDRRYYCLYANPAASRLAGLPVEAMIGKPLKTLAGGESWHQQVEEQIDRVHRARQTAEIEIEFKGRVFDWWLSPEFDADGRVTSISAVALDVTDRRRNEEALRNSEMRFRAMNDASPLGVFVDDTAGNCVYYNAVYLQLTGLKPEDIVARRWNDVIHPEDRERVAQEKARALSEPPYRFENVHRFVRNDGKVLWINARIIAMWDGDLLLGYLGLMEDITARIDEINIRIASEETLRQRSEDLENAVKDLESFSYTVSHDLRAPLRAIDGYSSLLQRELNQQASKDARFYMNSIRDNAQKMGHLIDDLLTFSRLGRAPLAFSRVDMTLLVHRVIESLRPDYEGRDLLIEVLGLPPCRGDEALLRQVWVNLLSNAIKFTRKTAKAYIEVGCKTEDNGEIIYYIRDNGAGFDMAFADKLFGVFQRLHHAGEFEGTGVGLATVHRIIKKHSGRIWARAAIGAGATFYFTLPASEGEGVLGLADLQHTEKPQ